MQITSQQFNAAFKRLPPTIKEYIANDDLSLITEALGHQYNLHIDTVGALYREVTNMLLGLINPEQFVGELRSVGVPQESIGAIVKDLNAKVFMPLREKMQHPTEESEPEEEDGDESLSNPPASSTSAYVQPAPQTPVYKAPTPPPLTPAPAYKGPAASAIPSAPASAFVPPAPMRPSVSEFSRPVTSNTIAPASVPAFSVPPVAPGPTPTPISSNNPQFSPAPYATITDNVHIAARTMAQDMQEAQSGHKNPPAQPATYAPAQQNTWSAPAPQPSATQAPLRSTQPTTATPITAPLKPQPLQSENRDALHAVLKEYGVDPYREPPV